MPVLPFLATPHTDCILLLADFVSFVCRVALVAPSLVALGKMSMRYSVLKYSVPR